MAKPNDSMARERLVDELVSLVQELPSAQLVAVSEYARGLQTGVPPRGTAQALIEALTHTGPLQFEPGQLDHLLAEIEALRQLDLEDHD